MVRYIKRIKEITMASETSIIKIFAKFIDPKVAKKLKTIDEILDLPISTYKFVDEELSKDLEENFNIINIGAVAKLYK